jgi:parallel beta-helix repeat protein
MHGTPKWGRLGGSTTAAALWALALLVISVCDAHDVEARTLYVRVSGDDANDGSSPALAMRHIKQAAAVAQPGDRIVVGPGTYAEGTITPTAFARVSFIADRRGTEVGEPPGDVVIDAATFATAFELNHNLATTIDGFVIYNAGIGIYVKSQSDQPVISNNIVSGNTDTGIFIQDSKQAVVFNNLVYNNARSGILIGGTVTGSPGARIISNTLYANQNRGIFFSGTAIGSPNGLVINNIVQANGVAGIQVNASSRDGYVSAANVSADNRFAAGTPVDITDVEADPLFVDPDGADNILGGSGYADDDFHLKQRAAGQDVTSPAVNAGTDRSGPLKLGRASTRTDGRPDGGRVDVGYHYQNFGRLPTRAKLRLPYKPLYVSAAKGDDTNDGSTPADALQTVARAFKLARPGNQVALLGGQYREGELTLTNSGKPGRDIRIRGTNGAVIDASVCACQADPMGCPCTRGILLSGKSNVIIDGLEVINAADSGIEIRNGSSAITVRRCRLRANGRRGLYVNNASAITLRSSLVERNGSRGVQVEQADLNVVGAAITGNPDTGLWAINGSMVAVSSSRFVDNTTGLLAEQSDVEVTDGTISGSKDGGARFTNGSTATVTRVALVNNPAVGVQGISSTVTVSGGRVEGNGHGGIEALKDPVRQGVSRLVVTGTRVCNNTGPGVHAQQATATLSDVRLCDNTGAGILADQSSVTVTGGTISGSKDGGARFTNGSTGTVTGVAVIDNPDVGIQGVSSAVTVSGGRVEGNGHGGIEALVDPVRQGASQLTATATQVCNNVGPGVNVQDAAVTLSDVTLCANSQEGVRLKGGAAEILRALVTENVQKGVSATDAISVTVRDAVVDNCGDSGIQIATTAATSISGSIVRRNGNDGITILDSPGTQLWNNLVYRNRSFGIVITGDTSGSPNARVFNNTIYGNADRGLLVGGSNAKPPSAGAWVLRNLFQGNGNTGLQVNQLSLPDYVGDYNLNVDRYGALTLVGAHDILVDPRLVDPEHDDFHLRPSSPAIDAGGVEVTAAGLQGTTTRADKAPDTGPVDLGYHYKP